ncbi:alpha/beta hydrolase [Rhodococcus sp. HNM0569]|uniref:alpha/beta hydrolase n=1 Tax=Rhodococcus sp. HNM0569 TaxID=2716340 RepID=UPI00146DA76A|nr:alpha/beta hydrolase [Rhodococcus sp. HNM0569]NLU84405.1 alpha/beta hydrolase [Rhodococcus sp. HNM0569]
MSTAEQWAPNHAAAPRAVDAVEVAGVSLQSQLLSHTVRHTVRPFLDAWSRHPDLPWPAGLVDLLGYSLPGVAAVRRTAVRLPHAPAELLRPAGYAASPPRAVLYLHGGAFLCCGLRSHRNLVSRIAAGADATVLNVAYRMLPHAPIRSAVADGLDGYRWLLAHGYPPERIVIAGDSAGGFLTFAVTLDAMRAGLPRPAANIAMSPLTDLDPAGKLAHPNVDRCAMFPGRALEALGGIVDRADSRFGSEPAASPVDGGLTDMPPALIQVGSDELVYPDAVLMAERLASAGVECRLEVWEQQVHVFQAAAGIVPEGGRATRRVARFVRAATA